MHKIRPYIGIVLSLILLAASITPQAQTILSLPNSQKIVVGEKSEILIDLPAQLESKLNMEVIYPYSSVFASEYDSPVAICKNSGGYEIRALKPGRVNVQLKILGYIPIKSISVEALPTHRVIVGGHSIGVLLQSKGIMVVGFAPITDRNGEKTCPARDQGVQIGDVILEVNGKTVKTENDLARIIDDKENRNLLLKIKRKDRIFTVAIPTVRCPETNRKRVGLYVRDGVVGVGTLTFWEPQSQQYAALGHVIMDADTKQGIDVLQGKIVSASIQNIKPGKPGRPGEKIGIFQGSNEISGNILKNSNFGIFGETFCEIKNPLFDYTAEIGYAHQIREGKAEIYTVVNGSSIEKFDIVIEKIYPERQNGKGMVIRVNDEGLLNLTGGIIQGMSGSPIVQEGKLIGAVTHVFLNDPQRGYGTFMDNILSEMPLMEQKISTN